MSLFKLIFLGLLFYFAYKLLSNVLRLFTPNHKTEVRGRQNQKKRPIDLSKHDVEDADFEDIQ